jgi:hypothetical protein
MQIKRILITGHNVPAESDLVNSAGQQNDTEKARTKLLCRVFIVPCHEAGMAFSFSRLCVDKVESAIVKGVLY